MVYIILIVFLLLSFIGGICLYKSVVVFFKIQAIYTNTDFKGIIIQSLNLNSLDWFKGVYIEIFPISYFLYKIDPRGYDAESEVVKLLYQQKYRYEKILWVLFSLGLLSIPLMEYVITPMLLK